jgi:hypothetical protein
MYNLGGGNMDYDRIIIVDLESGCLVVGKSPIPNVGLQSHTKLTHDGLGDLNQQYLVRPCLATAVTGTKSEVVSGTDTRPVRLSLKTNSNRRKLARSCIKRIHQVGARGATICCGYGKWSLKGRGGWCGRIVLLFVLMAVKPTCSVRNNLDDDAVRMSRVSAVYRIGDVLQKMPIRDKVISKLDVEVIDRCLQIIEIQVTHKVPCRCISNAGEKSGRGDFNTQGKRLNSGST